MANICKVCGSFNITEFGTYFEYRSFKSGGCYEINDSEYGDDWSAECRDCSTEDLFEFDEDYFTKDQIKELFDLPQEERPVYIMLKYLEKAKGKEFSRLKDELLKILKKYPEEKQTAVKEAIVLYSI